MFPRFVLDGVSCVFSFLFFLDQLDTCIDSNPHFTSYTYPAFRLFDCGDGVVGGISSCILFDGLGGLAEYRMFVSSVPLPMPSDTEKILHGVKVFLFCCFYRLSVISSFHVLTLPSFFLSFLLLFRVLSLVDYDLDGSSQLSFDEFVLFLREVTAQTIERIGKEDQESSPLSVHPRTNIFPASFLTALVSTFCCGSENSFFFYLIHSLVCLFFVR